jgi:mannose-6-phosphate isomerase-like protein (cupin superfamily)
MKCNVHNIEGNLVMKNDTYTVVDNTDLSGLVLSKTILHPRKSTSGHAHAGQEEVYSFTYGKGMMELDNKQFLVQGGDIVLIPDGAFHRVSNTSEFEDLTFICVFDGKRNH